MTPTEFGWFSRLAARASVMKRAAVFSSPTQVRVDDLHRHGAPEVRLLGPVHAAHAADPDELENDVAARQRAPDERIVGACGDLPDREIRTTDRTGGIRRRNWRTGDKTAWHMS